MLIWYPTTTFYAMLSFQIKMKIRSRFQCDITINMQLKIHFFYNK